MVIKRAYNIMGFASRVMALRTVAVFLLGTLVGSLVPESGSILAYNMGIFPHALNPLFLAVGIVGIGLACVVGHRKSG